MTTQSESEIDDDPTAYYDSWDEYVVDWNPKKWNIVKVDTVEGTLTLMPKKESDKLDNL